MRSEAGVPMVIRSALSSIRHPDADPLLARRPATLRAVSRIESTGGVRRAEIEVDPELIASAMTGTRPRGTRRWIPGHEGPRPSGGVGGTRKGVKCLHAHLAWYLAGGDDPVGTWTAGQLGLVKIRMW